MVNSVLTVSPLLAVLRFLACGTAAVSPGDILLLPGFGLHLAFARVLPFAASAKGDAILQNGLKIVFAYHDFFLIGLMGPIGPIRLIRPMGLMG